jgi:hypothetical protein
MLKQLLKQHASYHLILEMFLKVEYYIEISYKENYLHIANGT